MLSLNEMSADLLASSAGLRIKEMEQQQTSLLKSVICGFNQLLDLRDLGTGVHSTRLAEWAIRVARKLRIPETELYQLEVAALLHDIGKIGIPDSILKKEGKLTEAERALMNKHPELAGPSFACFRGSKRPASMPSTIMRVSTEGATRPG